MPNFSIPTAMWWTGSRIATRRSVWVFIVAPGRTLPGPFSKRFWFRSSTACPTTRYSRMAWPNTPSAWLTGSAAGRRSQSDSARADRPESRRQLDDRELFAVVGVHESTFALAGFGDEAGGVDTCDGGDLIVVRAITGDTD